LISSLKSQLKDNDKVLFKGSRGMKMEKIISGVFEA
jgi:UDP-N-acetylmuramyl pentapeptide synthase